MSHSQIKSYYQSRHDVTRKIKFITKNCNARLHQINQPNIIEIQQLTEKRYGMTPKNKYKKETKTGIRSRKHRNYTRRTQTQYHHQIAKTRAYTLQKYTKMSTKVQHSMYNARTREQPAA